MSLCASQGGTENPLRQESLFQRVTVDLLPNDWVILNSTTQVQVERLACDTAATTATCVFLTMCNKTGSGTNLL